MRPITISSVLSASACLLLAAFSPAASAQDWSSWGSTVQNGITNGMSWDSLRNDVGSGGGEAPANNILELAAAPSNLQRVNFEFTVNPSVRQAVLAEFVETLAETNPAMAGQFSQLDVFGIMSASLPEYGLSTTNFADAVTGYLISLHGAAHGKVMEPSSEVTGAVRQQVLNILGQVATPQDFDDIAGMQAASDDLLLQSVAIETITLAAVDQGGTAVQQTIAEAAAMTQEMFGVDFSQTTLDARGLTVN